MTWSIDSTTPGHTKVLHDGVEAFRFNSTGIIGGAVSLTGAQNIAGVKSFSDRIVAPGQLVAAIKMNGTGTPALLSGVNISSITDLAVGNYRLNFAVSLPDANYYVSVTPDIGGYMGGANAYLASSVGIAIVSDVGAYSDVALISALVFR